MMNRAGFLAGVGAIAALIFCGVQLMQFLASHESKWLVGLMPVGFFGVLGAMYLLRVGTSRVAAFFWPPRQRASSSTNFEFTDNLIGVVPPLREKAITASIVVLDFWQGVAVSAGEAQHSYDFLIDTPVFSRRITGRVQRELVVQLLHGSAKTRSLASTSPEMVMQ